MYKVHIATEKNRRTAVLSVVDRLKKWSPCDH